MTRPTVEIVIELGSDGQVTRDLVAGGIYLANCMLRLGEECELVVCGATQQLSLSARAVYVDEHGGAGLELIGFSGELKAQIAELASSEGLALAIIEDDLAIPIDANADAADPPDVEPAPVDREDRVRAPIYPGYPGPDDGAEPYVGAGGSDCALRAADVGGPNSEGAAAVELGRPAQGTLDPEGRVGDSDEIGDAGDERETTATRRLARNVHERLRGLNLAAQIKMATTGELHERIVLERLYGKNVWETLLRNPRLTAPEVSRIARYGSLPRVLLEIIIANNAWLQIPEVRRALLSNPRLATDQIMKVLRLTPKHELKLAMMQTAYPQAVRNAARMILRGE